ncbi:MAG: hypothetical protein JW894_04185 [Bacteroidales bacterium]|nr:hypothetical protein [Bacteroidales bacterium]
MIKQFYIIILSVLSCSLVYGQSSRGYIKAAEQFITNGYYEEAIQQYTKAIEFDPGNGKAYEERARANDQIGNNNDAAQDFRNAAVLGSNPAENYFRAAELFFQLGMTDDASNAINKALREKQKFHEAYLLQCQIFIEQENYSAARDAADNAISAKNTPYALYLKGLSEFRLGNFTEAEQNLEKAIIKDKLLLEAYLTLAELQLNTNKVNYSLKNSSFVIANDRNYKKAYIIRSKGYSALNGYKNAISDVSVAISLDSTNVEYYMIRGNYYYTIAQYQNAINDYTVALNYDMINSEAIKNRAIAYEKINMKEKAISDYSLMLTLTDKSETAKIADLEEKIFDLNRENQKPVISLTNPLANDDYEISIPEDEEEITISGNIIDKSKLKLIRINNDTILNSISGSKQDKFSLTVDVSDLEFLTITAIDIYDNANTVSYSVDRIEIQSPQITLYNPVVGDDGIIGLNSDDKFLYIEGRIEDESLIKSIKIDEVYASYVPGDINPRFTAAVDITKKNRIHVIATDTYENKTVREYLFRRDGRLLSDDSPMGKTWVVLIENSEYKDFSNLYSPSKDVNMMQQALSRYKINKVIIKRNLTKRELERFFSIDLRDLVRINNVNSLLIWYAGHGEFINGTGYWIPSDATMDVEFSYFNINALKASLYSYTSLTHLLVVSDACKTGDGFTIVMRGPIEGIACSETQLSLLKSAQVFTSAGQGYAYDNSLFTRTFANALLNNEDDCVTIDDIAKRVSIVLQNTSSQKPEFGRILGLEDKQGTFFFITR